VTDPSLNTEARLLQPGFCFPGIVFLSIMRDKKDIATFDLPGFEAAIAPDPVTVEPAAPAPVKRPRQRRTPLKQEQLQLLEETDASGLPVWRRDDQFDLTGLPVWAPA
jgi:hypothetical protein